MTALVMSGATGYIGRNLVPRLVDDYEVTALVRGGSGGEGVRTVHGSLPSLGGLANLDNPVDALVHLGAAIGGCSEDDGVNVNVLGTSRLLRYAIDRGCRRLVLASSVAVTGCLSADFVPEQLPVPDDHPCLARDAYGVSKAMMEEVAGYFARSTADAAVVCLRLGWVLPPLPPAVPDTVDQITQPFIELGAVDLRDVLRAIELAVRVPLPPGYHVLNIVGPDSRTNVPVLDVLSGRLGEATDSLDTTEFKSLDRPFAPVFAGDAAADVLGFRPAWSVRDDVDVVTTSGAFA